jgi:hypothetical protein
MRAYFSIERIRNNSGACGVRPGTANSRRNPGLSRTFDSSLRTSQNHDLTQVDKEAATGGAWRLLARSRLPPIRGYTPSAPRYGLPCVGCLKQMPNAVFQQFDSPQTFAPGPNLGQIHAHALNEDRVRWGVVDKVRYELAKVPFVETLVTLLGVPDGKAEKIRQTLSSWHWCFASQR